MIKEWTSGWLCGTSSLKIFSDMMILFSFFINNSSHGVPAYSETVAYISHHISYSSKAFIDLWFRKWTHDKDKRKRQHQHAKLLTSQIQMELKQSNFLTEINRKWRGRPGWKSHREAPANDGITPADHVNVTFSQQCSWWPTESTYLTQGTTPSIQTCQDFCNETNKIKKN